MGNGRNELLTPDVVRAIELAADVRGLESQRSLQQEVLGALFRAKTATVLIDTEGAYLGVYATPREQEKLQQRLGDRVVRTITLSGRGGNGKDTAMQQAFVSRNTGEIFGHTPGRNQRRRGTKIGHRLGQSQAVSHMLIDDLRREDAHQERQELLIEDEQQRRVVTHCCPVVPDASVLFAAFGQPGKPACQRFIELVRSQHIGLVVTEQIIFELNVVGKLGQRQGQVRLSGVTLEREDRENLSQLLASATVLPRTDKAEPIVLDDRSDGKYLGALERVRAETGKGVLVTRDKHLLHFQSEEIPLAERQIFHPARFLELYATGAFDLAGDK